MNFLAMVIDFLSVEIVGKRELIFPKCSFNYFIVGKRIVEARK